MASLLRKSPGVRLFLNVRYALESGNLKDEPAYWKAVNENPPDHLAGLVPSQNPPKLIFEDDALRARLLRRHPELTLAPFRRFVEARGFYEHPVDQWIREHKQLVKKGFSAKEAEKILDKKLHDRRYYAHVEADVHRRMALRRGRAIRRLDDQAAALLEDFDRGERVAVEEEKRANREYLVQILEERLAVVQAAEIMARGGMEDDMDGEFSGPNSFDYTEAEGSKEEGLADADADAAEEDLSGFNENWILSSVSSAQAALADPSRWYLSAEETRQFTRSELLAFLEENPRYERFFAPSFLHIADFRYDAETSSRIRSVDVDNEDELERAVVAHLRLGDPRLTDGAPDESPEELSRIPFNPSRDAVIPETVLSDEDTKTFASRMNLDFSALNVKLQRQLSDLGLSKIDSMSTEEIVDHFSLLKGRKK